mgnify:FL=1
MKILGIEKVSFVDYEGKMCATIFTGGCNYRCPFCHNGGIVLDKYKEISEDDILEYLRSRKGLLDAVTISGGEPTLQPDLKQFIIKVKKLGFLVKLDTNGTNPAVLIDLVNNNLLDYVAIDIKTNLEDYNRVAGVSNALQNNVQRSINYLKQSNINYELRTTLVNEFHTTESITKMADELAGQKKLYLQKFKASPDCINSVGLSEVPKQIAKEYADILKRTIPMVELRGY